MEGYDFPDNMVASGFFLVPLRNPSDTVRCLLYGFCHWSMEKLFPQDAVHLYSYLGADEFRMCGCGI